MKRETKQGREVRAKIVQATESLYRMNGRYHTRKEILSHAGLGDTTAVLAQYGHHFVTLVECERIGATTINSSRAVYCPTHIAKAMEGIEDVEKLFENLDQAIDTIVLISNSIKNKEASKQAELAELRMENENLKLINDKYKESILNLQDKVMGIEM